MDKDVILVIVTALKLDNVWDIELFLYWNELMNPYYYMNTAVFYDTDWMYIKRILADVQTKEKTVNNLSVFNLRIEILFWRFYFIIK